MRLEDKLNRARTISQKEQLVKDEKIKDTINDMAELGKALAPYEDIYISCRANYCDGVAEPLKEVKKPKKEYNTNVTITDFDIN